mgnify:CR=1 FL=1
MEKRKTSLRHRLNVLVAVCLIPLLVITLYLIILVYRFAERYDETVQNITTANEYNLELKEQVDYTMYIIVVNSERAEELVDIDGPQQLIGQAKNDFKELYDLAGTSYAKNILQRILKSLQSLENTVTEIKKDARVTGMYDRNLERLDLDIRVQTELIQDQIQEYINHEANDLAALKEGVRRDVSTAITLTVVLILVISMATVWLSRKISYNLTRGIDQLRMVTRKAGHGDFTVRADMKDGDEELEELADGFNQMVERIGNLVEDIQVEQLNLRTTEQKLLQAQINPHFLYNTLDAIIWLAEAEEKEQVIMMVTALSDFFRTTLSKGRDYITVEEEESHIRSYLQIQQFRYQDILEYEIDIPKEMYEYQILKLTLQPLVENALYHGIKNKRGMGRIRVSGHMDSGYMVFLVTDNGIGMTPEKLTEVQKEMNSEHLDEHNTDPSGFGLYNVVQRIRLNYGPQYGIWLSSTYGEGTEARIEIPAIKK